MPELALKIGGNMSPIAPLVMKYRKTASDVRIDRFDGGWRLHGHVNGQVVQAFSVALSAEAPHAFAATQGIGLDIGDFMVWTEKFKSLGIADTRTMRPGDIIQGILRQTKDGVVAEAVALWDVRKKTFLQGAMAGVVAPDTTAKVVLLKATDGRGTPCAGGACAYRLTGSDGGSGEARTVSAVATAAASE